MALRRSVAFAALACALALASCDGVTMMEDGGEADLDSGRSPTMDSGMDPSDAGERGDAQTPPPTRMAVPSGGISTVGPRPAAGSVRLRDEGFETNHQLCFEELCVIGSVRP